MRPCHPLICQVPVPALRPDEVTALDPDADAGSLRRTGQAACARPGGGGPSRRRPPWPSRPPGTELARHRQRRRLGMRSSMRPAKLGQPRHQPVQQAGGIRVGRGAVRPPGRPRRPRRSRPAATCARVPHGPATASRTNGSPGGRGPICSPRRTSSLSVNARGQAPGSVITAYRRFSRAIASTRLAWARSAARATRLRCEAISIPYRAMTEMTSGGGGSPPRIIPAERTGTRHAEHGQPSGQQRGRHRGPAYVRRAQHDNAVSFGIVLCGALLP